MFLLNLFSRVRADKFPIWRITAGLVLVTLFVSTFAATLGRSDKRIRFHRTRSDSAAERREQRSGTPIVAQGENGPRPQPAARDLEAYEGLGSWVDWIDDGPWDFPFSTLRSMKERGVQTLFVQTSTYGIKQTLLDRASLTVFIEESHRLGMKVVAWYVPNFAHRENDLRKSLAALNFKTPTGQRFDSFALDIEATTVQDIETRNQRLLWLSREIRAAAGPDYPLGAVIPDPIGSRYWPNFPYKEVAKTYDVFVPMGYFTFRARGYRNVAAYTAANIRAIRKAVGDPHVPVHAIGGIAGETGPNDVRGFVDALRRNRALGGSFYDFPITTEAEWRALSHLSRGY